MSYYDVTKILDIDPRARQEKVQHVCLNKSCFGEIRQESSGIIRFFYRKYWYILTKVLQNASKCFTRKSSGIVRLFYRRASLDTVQYYYSIVLY